MEISKSTLCRDVTDDTANTLQPKIANDRGVALSDWLNVIAKFESRTTGSSIFKSIFRPRWCLLSARRFFFKHALDRRSKDKTWHNASLTYTLTVVL